MNVVAALGALAAGRFDAYWERGIKPWDIAAGVLMITEAGGAIASADGGPFDLSDGTICCANLDLQPQILERLKAVAPEKAEAPEV